MNSIALNHFFLINDIYVPGRERFVAFKDQPPETLSILRSALFIKRLTYFDFDLSPQIERTLSEVSDIRVLAARLLEMEVVSLHFPNIDSCTCGFARLPMDSWYKAITRLLVTILDKGCTELRVVGGTQFYHRKLPQSTKAEVNTNEQRLNEESCIVRPRKLSFNIFRRIRQKRKTKHSKVVENDHVQSTATKPAKESSGETASAIPSEAENLSAAQEPKSLMPSRCKLRLAEVYIQSDMLLHYPFAEWTLSTLNAASSTIAKLSIKLTQEASSAWKTFSSSLSLPFLRIFSLTNDLFIPLDVASFTDVEDFLVNHPGIGNLSLYGVGFPPACAVPRASFQHLDTIDAHPFYIIWLMNSLRWSPNALPSLRNITISSDNHSYCTRLPEFDDSLFDSALEALCSFPRDIALTLTFNSKSHIDSWIGSHVRAGVQHSVIPRLVHVTSLSIDNNNWREFSDATVDIIPDWIALFPALERLKFEWEVAANKKRLTEPQFLATISMLCQKLEMMEVNWKTFDLRVIRKNLGAAER
ncbi:hypothetical protein M413DRAFT_71736 [Hebeloma cylindrosporum]|uniref:F-box domain-containing protein n=1 Tax=Hebeloma cylindrosporum TaxID=76867 RepID=A0A0C3CAM0_HEBCY|nr:hypothetical protein M413DRAFT_71736 [Hebeloma cylindrosporum h7]